MQRFLDFWEWRCMERGSDALVVRDRLATKSATCFLLWLVELLSASFRCTRLSKSAGRKPASIGRLRAGYPETRVNTGLAGRQAGNARKQWAGGQGIRRWPFYAGFGAGGVGRMRRRIRAGGEALGRGNGACCGLCGLFSRFASFGIFGEQAIERVEAHARANPAVAHTRGDALRVAWVDDEIDRRRFVQDRQHRFGAFAARFAVGVGNLLVEQKNFDILGAVGK